MPIHRIISALSFTALLFMCNKTAIGNQNNHDSIDNLAYGTSLYYFFQDKYFSAITDLLVAKEQNKLNSNSKNAELLLGGMYLSYGLTDKASAIFTDLLDNSTDNTPESVRDKAFYHLGKYYYDKNNFLNAENSLSKIHDNLSDDKNAERLLMLTNIYLNNSQPEKAIQLLGYYPDGSVLKYYAEYNIGIYLIRNNMLESAKEHIEYISDLDANNFEEIILRDKSNIALAYSYLKHNDYENANSFFWKVRIQGSQTNQALLGLGLAWEKLDHNDQAIIAWNELIEQNIHSRSRDEAMLLLSNAYEKLNQPKTAIEYYDMAINHYTSELNDLNIVIKNINNGTFIKQLETFSLGTESATLSNTLQKLDFNTNKYLSDLLTSQDFQNAIREMQELAYLSFTLDQWETDIPALKLILEEKRLTYNDKISKTDYNSVFNFAQTLKEQREQIAQRITNLEKDEMTLDLANSTERETLEKLDSIIYQSKTNEEVNQKAKFMRGLIAWNITTQYAERLWETKKELQDLDLAAKKMNSNINNLVKLWKKAPDMHNRHLQTIQEKSKEITLLRQEVRHALNNQRNTIVNMAISSANDYIDRIKLYHDRALFAKARIYDYLTLPPATTH